MRTKVLIVLACFGLGCASTLTADECKGYATLTKSLSLQLAEIIDPASPDSEALRKRWANVGELAAQAGCEQWAEPTE